MQKGFIIPALFLLLGLIECSPTSENTSAPAAIGSVDLQATWHKQETIQEMKGVCDSLIRNTKIPGIVALVYDQKKEINWFYACGISDIDQKLPMDTGLIFRAGSITKSFVGTVILQLVGEGKLSLDDSLAKFLPDFPRANELRIRMLCNMTSGIFNYPETKGFMDLLKSKPDSVWTLDVLSGMAAAGTPHNKAGEKFRYSNSNTVILAQIIEKITGNSVKSEIESRILKPLELKNTSYLESGRQFPGPHCKAYYEGAFVPDGEISERYDISWIGPAGCISSTPRDLQKFCEAWVDGSLLSDSLRKILLTDVRPFRDKLGYGICTYKRGTFYGHNGGIPGFSSSMYHSPEKKATIVIYYNAQLEGLHPDKLFYRFADILYGADF